MAYVAPTPAEMKTRFPEFAAVSDGRVQAFIDEASRFADDSWIEADRKIAVQFLTAHMMTSEGLLNPAGAPAAGAVSGPITSEKMGDASTSYGSRSAAGGYKGADADIASTPYGIRFLAIRGSNFSGPLVF